MIDLMKIAESECGSFALTGMMMAFPLCYAFVISTSVKHCKEIINKHEKRIKDLENSLEERTNQYIQQLENR